MNKKSTNLLIIICNILFCITLIVVKAISLKLDNDPLYFTASKLVIGDIYSTLCIILCIELFFINIVSAIQNKKNKIIMFLFFLIVIMIICLIRGTFFLEVNPLFIFLPIVIIINIILILFINKQDNYVKEGKARSIVNFILYKIILLGTLIVLTIVGIIYLINKSNTIKYEYDYFDKIIIEIQNHAIEHDKEKYIRFKYNNKYGYIGEDGKIKIESQYDEADSEFSTVQISNKKYDIAFVKKNEEYYLITKNNYQIDLGEKPAPWLSETSRDFDKTTMVLHAAIDYKDGIEWYYDEENKDEIKNNLIEINNTNINLEYTFSIKGYEIYNINIEKNGSISRIENVYIPVEYEYTSQIKETIQKFSDGQIPFYDIAQDVQGWISTSGEKVDYVRRKLHNIRHKE